MVIIWYGERDNDSDNLMSLIVRTAQLHEKYNDKQAEGKVAGVLALWRDDTILAVGKFTKDNAEVVFG